MCEAEDEVRKLYRWLKKNHPKVHLELIQLDAEEVRRIALE